MTRTKVLLSILLSLLLLSACSKVPAGYRGVKVYLLGGDKGVESEELGVGRYWIGWNEDLFLFPTFTQNYVWTRDKNEGSPNDESITFQTKEGLSVNADVGISYAVKPTKINEVFQRYRKGIKEITDVFLRNMVRDAFVTVASTKPIDSVYGTGKAELVKAVEAQVRAQVGDWMTLDRIYLIGNLRLPKTVVQAIDAKIEATQRAIQRQNEVNEARAQADKDVAKAEGQARAILAVAQAQARANSILAKSITPELVRYRAVEKWTGTLPKFTGGGAIPLIELGLDVSSKGGRQ